MAKNGLRAFSACLLVALAGIVAACGSTAAASTTATPSPTAYPTYPPLPTSTPVTPTATPAPPTNGKALAWKKANLPAGFGEEFHVSDVAIAPSDGHTAYSCANLSGGVTGVIVTHDAGATWRRVTNVPQKDACTYVTIDQSNPATLAVSDTQTTFGVSYDGGTTWSKPNSATGQIYSLATRQGHTIALLGHETNDSVVISLEESDDQMRTWHQIDTGIAIDPSDGGLDSFVVNPTNGDILVTTAKGARLWVSRNNGGSWSEVHGAITGRGIRYSLLPQSGTDWRTCASYDADGTGSSNSFTCTLDSGKTWTQLPLRPELWSILGIAPDGAILAASEFGGDPQTGTVYRLPKGATRWQKLGSGPPRGTTAFYFPAQGGVFWILPAESSGGPIFDQPTDVYSAAYPY